MALIDIDALREYLTNYCGTAVFNGSPAAILDVWNIESATGEELCRKAEDMGVDLSRFVIEANS